MEVVQGLPNGQLWRPVICLITPVSAEVQGGRFRHVREVLSLSSLDNPGPHVPVRTRRQVRIPVSIFVETFSPMDDAYGGDAIVCHRQKGVQGLRMVEVKDEWRNQSSRNDPDGKTVDDLHLVLFEASAKNFQMVRQP